MKSSLLSFTRPLTAPACSPRSPSPRLGSACSRRSPYREHPQAGIATLTEHTPHLAKAYASKTLQRDLNELTQQDLIERDGRKVRARRELIFAFLPLKKRG